MIATASGMVWSRGVVTQLPDAPEHLLGLPDAERRRGFVEHHDLAAERHRAGDRDSGAPG